MGSLLTRLFRDDGGQDVIEYALLCAGIGLAGVAVWPAITAAVSAAYQGFDTNTQNIWIAPNPSGS
jgi:Flp pilus assembly pilin Flp